jgi:hypothetical protein
MALWGPCRIVRTSDETAQVSDKVEGWYDRIESGVRDEGQVQRSSKRNGMVDLRCSKSKMWQTSHVISTCMCHNIYTNVNRWWVWSIIPRGQKHTETVHTASVKPSYCNSNGDSYVWFNLIREPWLDRGVNVYGEIGGGHMWEWYMEFVMCWCTVMPSRHRRLATWCLKCLYLDWTG